MNIHAHSRIKILTLLSLMMMAIFVARLFYMQIIRHDYYVARADQEQIKSLVIPATRGEIWAMDGSTPQKIVLNEPVYTVFVDPKEVTNPTAIVKAVREVAGGEVSDDIETLVNAKPSRYKIVAKNITLKQAEKLKEKRLKGLGFQKTTRRIYPEGQLAAQTLGFVNAEGKGQYGVEESLQSQLQGKDGLRKSVTDVSNIPLTIGSKNTEVPAKNGANIVLSIDRNIQAYTEKALADGLQRSGATRGSAVVMDPQSGKIMAMANLPTYNPEKYNQVMDAQAFNNSVVMRPYEPGSVMKAFTAAIGLDTNTITPKSTYNNIDRIAVQGAPNIGNATKGQTGTITIQKALNYSLNTGFVTVADRLGGSDNPPGDATINRKSRDIMYQYLHDRFGLGQTTGVEVANEQAGVIISPTEVQGNPFRYANMSFGQGMNLTMVQVAAGFCSIVNGGNYYKPTVLAGIVNDSGEFKPSTSPSPVRQTISPAASASAKQMVHDARAEFYSGKDRKGYDVGGKTGTSQTLINGSYDNDQTVASYLGYGGDTRPRYVIMIQVSADNKKFAGNTDALPIFTDISNWMIDYMKLQPQGN